MQTHAETFGDTQATYAYALSGNDSITGSYGNDVLLGYAGNDSLLGGTGNDSLLAAVRWQRQIERWRWQRQTERRRWQRPDAGGAGAAIGGAGNDIYYVDNTGDKVYETTSTTSTNQCMAAYRQDQ